MSSPGVCHRFTLIGPLGGPPREQIQRVGVHPGHDTRHLEGQSLDFSQRRGHFLRSGLP